ncbi:MAG: hypothetical protein HKN03_12000 [Acidimicrobiales bacterium]|nr:hypothetical protein [Acidimicrobiales bacterium]
MTDQREAELRQWIQEAAATSRPIKIEDVLNRASVEIVPIPTAGSTRSEKPLIVELTQESPVTNKRNLYLALAATAAAVVLIAFALTDGSPEDAGVASQVETTTSTTPTITSTTIEPTHTDLATEFWQALEAGDLEQALALVDPAAIDSPDLPPFGRGHTLSGVFDWYETVGWKWQLTGCVEIDDQYVSCLTSGSNAWSDALGVEPIMSRFRVRFSEDKIIAVEDEGQSFLSNWSPRVFEKFATWVSENHPDEAAIMFDFEVDLNQEILDLYAINTVRFVESLQGEE